MAGHIKDHDRGYNALKERLAKATEPIHGTIGIHEAEGSAAEEDGTTVLDVAHFMEFGTDSIPPRSFVGDYSDENIDKNRERLRKIGKAVVKGTLPSMEIGMNRIGLLLVSEMQARIRSGIAPELSPATVERKGSSTPLIDTGQLWTSIRHKVTKGDGEDE